MVSIYNTYFEQEGVFREVMDLKVSDKVMEVGPFSFKVPFTEENLRICAPDNIIDIRTTGTATLPLFQGIIETCYIEKDKQLIEVSGNSIEVVLDWKPPYPRLWSRDSKSYQGCHFEGPYYEGEEVVDYFTRNLTFRNTSGGDDENMYFSIGYLLKDIQTFFLYWFGLYIDIDRDYRDYPRIPFPTQMTEIPINNTTLLKLLKLVMDRLYPDYYLKFFFGNEYGMSSTLKIYFVRRETVSLSSELAGISNITYTNTTNGAVDYAYTEWELEASALASTVFVTKEGKYSYNRREGSSMPYEFQATISGWTTYTGTLSIANVMEVEAVITKGVSRVSGDPATGVYMSCTKTPTVTFRRNDASGATISGPKIDSATLTALRAAGVTQIHITISCGGASSGWGAPNYGGGADSSGTKPKVVIKYSEVDTESNRVQIAYVKSPYIPSGRSAWFDKCLHKSESGYDKVTEIDIKRARLTADLVGDVKKPSTSYEFVLDANIYNLSKGSIVTIYDADFDETFTKVVSEIEYIFTGEDYDKVYSLTDYLGGA